MEYAFKMFNKNLTCTLGRGTFQYKPGKWYEESDKEANCVRNGFHAAKNPLDCLSYYPDFEKSQCWIVEIDGDIDEDERDSKVSSQKIRLVRKIGLSSFVSQACIYIMEHPELEYNYHVTEGPAVPNSNHFAISVGERPKARGKTGDVLGILKRFEGSREIEAANCFVVDGDDYKPGVWYDENGDEVTEYDQEE